MLTGPRWKKTCARYVNPGPTGIRCCVCVGPVLLLCLSAVSVFCLFCFARPVARWAICLTHPRSALCGWRSGSSNFHVFVHFFLAARWQETYTIKQFSARSASGQEETGISMSIFMFFSGRPVVGAGYAPSARNFELI